MLNSLKKKRSKPSIAPASGLRSIIQQTPIMETVQSSTQPIMETVSEIEKLRQTLSDTHRLLVTKNAAIAKLESQLSTARQEKLEADLEVDRLESELATRPTQSENSVTVGTDLSEIEPADLLNRVKARRKKSRGC